LRPGGGNSETDFGLRLVLVLVLGGSAPQIARIGRVDKIIQDRDIRTETWVSV